MKERNSHSLFLYVAHFYQNITPLRTCNLIFQGRMGRVRCPQVPPGVTSARWEAETCIDPVRGWRRGAGTSLHWPSPLLRWSTSPASCLPFLSFTQISPIPPSFKTSCSVLVSLSVSFCPLSVGQSQEVLHDTFSRQKRQKGHKVEAHLLLWEYGLTPSFGCCDGKCKCVTGVHNLVWKRREGLHLAIAVVLAWLQMMLVTLSSLHSCGQTDHTSFLPNSAWENHKTIK